MAFINKKSGDILFFVLFVALSTLVIVFRWFVLDQFAFKFADSDQAIMWNAAIDFSRGIFHEPRFFGQNYNSMLEGILAAPLLLFSVPVYKALPITTSFLALFPFFFVSSLCLLKGLRTQAILVLSVPLFLPVEYDFLTSLSRGFVTGIFISSFGWIAIFFKDRSWAIFSFGFFCVIGYSLNQNVLLLSLPLFVYLLFEKRKSLAFYICIGTGVILGGILHFFANHFYVVHPNYNSRPTPTFNFSFNLWKSAFQNLDQHLNFVSPVFWSSGSLIFVGFAFFAFWFIKKKQFGLAIAVSLLIFCFISSFGLGKIHEGTGSVFYSYSRMFLAVPLAFVFFIPFLNIKYKWVGISFALISVFFFAIKINRLPDSIEKNVDHKRDHFIAVDPIAYILAECHKINYYSKKYKTDLVIVYDHGYYDFIDFGCSACLDSFPKTLRPEFERRTWRLVEDNNVVYPDIIVIDEHQKLKHHLSELTERSISCLNVNGYYIFSNNSLTTKEFLNIINIHVRSF